MHVQRIPDVISAVQSALDRQSSNAYRAARIAGLPDNSIRYLLDGREVKLGKLIEICRAVGLHLYITPSRGPLTAAPKSVKQGPHSQISALSERRSGEGFRGSISVNEGPHSQMEPVRDRRLAELLARLADHWETLDASEHERLADAVIASLNAVRRERERTALARVVEWLGWRVIEGGADHTPARGAPRSPAPE